MMPVCCFCFLGALMMLFSPVACHNENDDDDDDDDQESIYDYSYVQDSCQMNNFMVITPGSGEWRKYGFIMADSDGCYDPNVNCGYQLNVSFDHRITIRFQEISTYCYSDIVQIIGESNTRTFCGSYEPTYSLYSSSNWLGVEFHSGGAAATPGSCLTGFKLYYTAYHTGECSEDEFKCDFEGRCIPGELRCDMYDNCGDWSDERPGTCGLSTGAITAISIISALLGLSLIVFVGYCIYEKTSGRKTRRRQRSTRNNSVFFMDITQSRQQAVTNRLIWKHAFTSAGTAICAMTATSNQFRKKYHLDWNVNAYHRTARRSSPVWSRPFRCIQQRIDLSNAHKRRLGYYY